MSRRWQIPVLVLLVALHTACLDTTVVLADRSALPGCLRAALGNAPASSYWHIYCEEDNSESTIAFDPVQLDKIVLGHSTVVQFDAPRINLPQFTTADGSLSAAKANVFAPAKIYASASFSRIEPLESLTVTSFSLVAEAEWVHKIPIHTEPHAFASLHTLERLSLQDVPLADSSLHLVLPPTIQHISITACGLTSFSFETIAGGAPSSFIYIDLHSNQLTAIPPVLYTFQDNIAMLDLRLNQFASITVSSRDFPVLRRWIKNGIIQLDNPQQSCATGSQLTQIQGTSQLFSVCVTPTPTIPAGQTESGTTSSLIPPVTATKSSSVAEEASVHPPLVNNQTGVSESKKQDREEYDKETDAPRTEGAVHTSTHAGGENSEKIYVALACVAAVVLGLIILILVLVFANRRARRQSDRKTAPTALSSPSMRDRYSASDGYSPTNGQDKHSRPSFVPSMISDDIVILGGGRRDSATSSGSACSSVVMLTSLPEFNKGANGGDRYSTGSSVSCINTPPAAMAVLSYPYRPASNSTGSGSGSIYSTLSTPRSQSQCRTLSQGYIMSKTLQSITGVNQFQSLRASHERVQEQRQRNRDLLRTRLADLGACHETLYVNAKRFVCLNRDVEDTDTGALTVRCHRMEDPSRKLVVKVYVEQDLRVARREYRALRAMQNTTKDEGGLVVPQLIAAELEKTWHEQEQPRAEVNQGVGQCCAALVMEAGSATTLRHMVRGQIDRSDERAMLQPLRRVVQVLQSLHERQFIHGALHLDALAMYLLDSGGMSLKLHGLEYATRFGDIIPDFSPLSLELLPPEMTHHLLAQSEHVTLSRDDHSRRQAQDREHGDTDDDHDHDDVPSPGEYAVLRASPSLDVWSLGVLILHMYTNSKRLDEFNDCESALEIIQRIAAPEFSFERSLSLYVHHDLVRELARQCLQRDARQRPTMASIASHRVFHRHDEVTISRAPAVSTTVATSRQPGASTDSVLPSVWLFLPPRALGLDTPRSIAGWVEALTNFQQKRQPKHRRHQQGMADPLLFPLLFLCEDTHNVSAQCSSTGFHRSGLRVPSNMLALVMPLAYEAMLFCEAKAQVSEGPTLSVEEVSALGGAQWHELSKFYCALDVMQLAPSRASAMLLLKPLEDLLARGDRAVARQVLDELKCLAFGEEKRSHVRDLLQILRSLSANTRDSIEDAAFRSLEDAELAMDEEMEYEQEDDERDTVDAREWGGLRACQVASETSTSMPSTRWLCARHAECEMEWPA